MKTPKSSIERLESRIAPAGVIAVTFAGGKLTLVGDGVDNDVVVFGAGVEHTRLIGNGGTMISLNGDAPVAAIDLFTPIQKLTAKMDGGNDVLTIQQLSLPGGLSVDGEAGNDTLVTVDLHECGKFSFTGEAGTDAVTIAGTATRLKSLTVDLGDGVDSLVVTPSTLRIAGSTKIAAGAGDDAVAFVTGHAFLGSVSIDGGDGANNTSLSGSDLSIHGKADFKNGTHPMGTSAVVISGAVTRIDGKLNVSFVDGTNTFTLGGGGNVRVSGGLTLMSGDGDDSVTVASGGNTELGGATKILLGGGTNATIISGPVVSTGSLLVNGGSGADTLTIGATSLRTNGPLTVAFGDGLNSTTFSGTNLEFGGQVNVSGGTGDDSMVVSASSMEFGSGINITLGMGLGTAVINGGGLVVRGSVITTMDAHAAGTSVLQINASTLEVGGSVKATFGEGENTTSITSPISLAIKGGVTGTADGNGVDNWIVSAPAIDIGGKVSVTSGHGGSTLSIMASAGNLGGFSAKSGDGPDNVTVLLPGAIQGACDVTLGVGMSTVLFDGLPAIGLRIGGPVTITTGGTPAQTDVLTMGNILATKPAAITLGDGMSVVNLFDSIYAKFLLDTKGGGDVVSLDINDSGIVSIFKGAATFLLGEGDDGLSLGNNTTLGKIDFRNKVKIDGGEGTETLVDVGNLYLPGQPVITNI